MQINFRVIVAIAIMLLFYVSGLIGMSSPLQRDWFVSLTPLNLILTTFLFLWANKDSRKSFLIICSLIYIICFFVEVAGVHTKAIFGSYQYGPVLGYKWLQVPLLIGANWLILVLSSAGMVQDFKIAPIYKWIISALLMVALDWLIEPMAIKLQFWTWQTETIPVQNYISWFVVSFLMQALLSFSKPHINRLLATVVFLLQIIFFIVLHIIFYYQ